MSTSVQQMIGPTTWALSVIVALLVGGFLKSYTSNKGENLATHEDIEKLVEQVRAVTNATEKIKAAISTEQREWNLKREVLFEAVRDMATLQHAAWKVASISAMAKRTSSEHVRHLKSDASSELNIAISAFWKSRTLVDITFGQEVSRGFLEIGGKLDALGRLSATDEEDIVEHVNQIREMLDGLSELIRGDILCRADREGPGSGTRS